MDWVMALFDPATYGSMYASFLLESSRPEYWVAVLKIIWIDLLLSGDNALVIALACRGLPPRQRMWGMILGAGAAVGLRVIFASVVTTLMTMPYLKLIGGIALIFIAAKLLIPEKEDESKIGHADSLWQAIRLIVIADVVMSLDNVIAIAAAADGSLTLLVFGLLVSIPLIIAGAALIMKVLDRLPILVWAGAALLGWIAGHVIATDPAVAPFIHQLISGTLSLSLDATSPATGVEAHTGQVSDIAEIVMSLICVVIVLIIGSIWRARKMAKEEAAEAHAHAAETAVATNAAEATDTPKA